MDGPYNGPVYITFIYNLNMEDLVMSITKELPKRRINNEMASM
jgi:hypothetical protein